MAEQWFYASVEWIWQGGTIRINIPHQQEVHQRGSYQEVVETLTRLGMQGWEVVACVGVGDWIYWTLKHRGES